MASNSELLPPLREAGYVVEPAVGDLERTSVVEIPVDVGEGIRTLKEVGMWEQLAFAAFLQRHWADNQVRLPSSSAPPPLPSSFLKGWPFLTFLPPFSLPPSLPHFLGELHCHL